MWHKDNVQHVTTTSARPTQMLGECPVVWTLLLLFLLPSVGGEYTRLQDDRRSHVDYFDYTNLFNAPCSLTRSRVTFFSPSSDPLSSSSSSSEP